VLFVCPQCRGGLTEAVALYRCDPCVRDYPVVCGIPDFRLRPDPYIGLAEDREKGELLWAAAQHRSFEQLLRHYYHMTEEDPADLAARWIPHSLSEPAIAGFVLERAGLSEAGTELLDIGCSTGGMLIAAARPGQRRVTGVDVAFRWLVVGQARLREAGVSATLVCANAESLPFPDGRFDVVTAQDALEHFFDPLRAIREGRRVSQPGATSLWTTNNRYCPLPEPHVHLLGVGFLPRPWQAPYVEMRRDDLHPYRIRMRGAGEWARIFAQAGYPQARVEPAPLFAPHWRSGALQAALVAHNRVRVWPALRQALRIAGPRLWIRTGELVA
jgi:SAM-dependent methyltransferase